ncbi:CPBP family intramembrane glutamic endopeptidase [Streptantibioticus ferralitis]|uniref:CPBP family intramembrane metalloprotease n=1 Tax=Streptantibioticus ferralitis TaxID=236510 RepID=A0ABT5Z0Q9_9ACTN|nr:CPBP family intramembrane glutamic endopeptidase [Streptantibioticus ferralitis]MDF2257419.1 CPBP family intramembrane metalloprotease [Streptantibioticus ferralitis]
MLRGRSPRHRKIARPAGTGTAPRSTTTAAVGNSPLGREHRRHEARAGLKTYFLYLVVLTALSDAGAIATGKELPWLLMEMWSPGAAAIITRAVRREGFSDVSFQLRSRGTLRMATLGALYPVAVAVVAYSVGWMTHLARLVAPANVLGVHFPAGMPAAAQVTLSVILVPLLGGLVNIVPVLGEELGWRGYMLTRLIDAEVPRPVLVGGLIWGLWHMPVIFGGVYLAKGGGQVAVVALLFLLSILTQNHLMAWLRLRTGSIWPSVAYHATWNAIIQGALDPATSGSHAWLFLGEQGVVLLAVNLAGVRLILSGRRGAVQIHGLTSSNGFPNGTGSAP